MNRSRAALVAPFFGVFFALVLPAAAQEPLPLLGSSHAKSVWEQFCEDPANIDAPLPIDPRRMIQRGFGTNEGKAVFFNAYWEDCHANLGPEEQQPETCREYIERRDYGRHILFELIPSGSTSPSSFNGQAGAWNLQEPYDQKKFEEMLILRYGANHAPFRNPYPVGGEDPNATNGGFGQLPLGFRQNKDADGNWTGTIGTVACFGCHGGPVLGADPADRDKQVEDASLAGFGAGNSNFDVVMLNHDAMRGFPVYSPLGDGDGIYALGVDQRGLNNAVFAFEVLAAILDKDSLEPRPHIDPNALNHNSSGIQDTPQWWNLSHRPRKFYDAGISMDSNRIVMAAGGGAGSGQFGEAFRDTIERYDTDLALFLDSLTSPPYPAEEFGLDTAKAEAGAVIFHKKDLFADRDDKPLGGNGSCASCHGAYSPRYVHDPEFLDDPVLEGVAGHITPLELIGTDRSRADNLPDYYRDQFGRTFWGYPDGVEGWTDPDEKDPLTEFIDDDLPNRPAGLCMWEREVIGYQAPPLYGVWASAPYFHNGSVPTVEQVLDTSKRPQLWRRAIQTIDAVSGFDHRLDVAYDHRALGWKHEALECGDRAGSELEKCMPVLTEEPSLFQVVLNVIKENLNLAAAVTQPQRSEDAVENRLIYDTRKTGYSNAGHDFGDVLTDAEREAVIEYLKTL